MSKPGRSVGGMGRIESGSSGYTLGEVLVSLLILSMMSVVLVGVIPSTVVGLKSAGQRAFAATLAQERLEELKRDGFGNIVSAPPPYPVVSSNGTQFTVQVTVGQALAADGTPMPVDEAKDVQVAVLWKARSGAQRHVARQTVFKRI